MAWSMATPNSKVAARAGVHIEWVTIIWMVAEGLLTFGAGIAAHSLLLMAFGVDSGIELVSGTILLWRLTVQARGASLELVEEAERRAAWIVVLALAGLILYILVSAGRDLVVQTRPAASLLGLSVAAVAMVGMPILARRKRRLAAMLHSAALRGDAACSMSCAAMAATLFLGLALNALLGWWWIDPIATLVFLVWLIPEAREALAGARAGKGACTCGDDDCNSN